MSELLHHAREEMAKNLGDGCVCSELSHEPKLHYTLQLNDFVFTVIEEYHLPDRCTKVRCLHQFATLDLVYDASFKTCAFSMYGEGEAAVEFKLCEDIAAVFDQFIRMFRAQQRKRKAECVTTEDEARRYWQKTGCPVEPGQ